MKDNLDLAWGWLRKADSDLADAHRTVGSEGPYDTACFHCQQAVEKCLKAFLALHGKPIPKSHDLEELSLLCLQIEQIPGLTELPLEELSGYAVEMRYDAEFWPSLETATEALAVAKQLRRLFADRIPSLSEEENQRL